jgi:outer membrane protein with beta-barrel domain
MAATVPRAAGAAPSLPFLVVTEISNAEQEARMSGRLAVLVAAVTFIGGGRAHAQDTPPGPGTVEVTVIPGGAMYFTDHNGGTPFRNYTLGAGVTYNVNRIVGVEAEVGGSLGLTQTLTVGGVTSDPQTPNILTYTGNLIVSLPTHSSFVPYATGGIGALSMFQRPELGVTGNDTFLTGNVGGGVKWYAPNGRWGLRGDYRFMSMRSNDTAPAFFGPSTRFSNRVYGALIVNAVR